MARQKSFTAGELRSAKADAKKELSHHKGVIKDVGKAASLNSKQLEASKKAANAVLAKAMKEHAGAVKVATKLHDTIAKDHGKSTAAALKAAEKAAEKLNELESVVPAGAEATTE